MKKTGLVLIRLLLLLSVVLFVTPAFAVNPGDIVTVAGGGVGDNGVAVSANIYFPYGTAIDGAGNIFIADNGNNRLRKVAAGTGIITTVAGNGTYGHSGDGGPATSASLYNPSGVVIDSTGNIYIAEYQSVRKIEAGTGVITTVADYSIVNGVTGVAVDSDNNLFIADSGNSRILKVAAISGVITTVAGNGTAAFFGDNDLATSASLKNPTGVVVDSTGNIYIADRGNNRIRMVTATTGFISTIAGNGTAAFSGDNDLAVSASLSSPYSIALDNVGNIYIADQNNFRIRKIDFETGTITTVAGNGTFNGPVDNVSATSCTLYAPTGITVDNAGNLYVAAYQSDRVRKVDAVTGIITTIAGNGWDTFSGENVAATSAALKAPSGTVLDSNGDLYFADSGNNRIRKVAASSGIITTIAGNGFGGFLGNNVVATSAQLYEPQGLAIDGTGNLYIADTGDNRIRKVAAGTGIITTVAGYGNAGYNGDNKAATLAWINWPRGVVVDNVGNLFISDSGNNRIRKVAVGTGVITTVAGDGTAGSSGDGGFATVAQLNNPYGIAIDNAGNLYIADYGNHRVRKVAADTGMITTVAGNGAATFSGDNGPATLASLFWPSGIAVDSIGNIYIADTSNNRVRMVSAATGIITTVAGGGYFGSLGDNGPASLANLTPFGVAVDNAGNLYIADNNNNRIRMVYHPGNPTIITNAASSLTQSTATLNGTANDNGAATTVTFEYGPTSSYGSTAVGGSVAAGAGETTVTANITGLACGTSYHFRVTGSNSAGNVSGADATFTTSACSPIDGVCGSANGKTFPIIPTTNLCTSGTASIVAGSGPWNWTCSGLYGGNPASCVATYVPDTVPPTLTLSMLADGAVTTENMVNITGVAKDNINGSGIAWVKVNGNPVEFNAVNGVFSYPLPLMAASTLVTIDSADMIGNSTTATRTINRDVAAPLLTISTPYDIATTSVALIDVRGTVEAGATVSVSLNGAAPVAAQVADTIYTAQVTVVNTTTLNTIQVTAVGLSGKSSSVKRSVRLNTARWSMDITDPPQDMLTSAGTYLLKGKVANLVNAPLAIVITRGTDTYTPTVTDGVFEQEVTFPTVGLHTFSVLGTDSLGNKLSVARTFNKIDAEPPVITGFSMPGTYNALDVPLTFTVSDNVGVTEWCQVYGAVSVADNCVWTNSAPVTRKFNSQGTKTITGFVKDAAGNISAPATASVTISFPVTLTVTVTNSIGAGGTVTSSPQGTNPNGISCVSGPCSTTYTYNQIVSMLQTPDDVSVFSGWGGVCSGKGTCEITMTASKDMTASFVLAPKAKIGGNEYASLTAAYSAANSGETILVLDSEMPDNGLEINEELAHGKSINLAGGYKADYSGKSGLPTYLKGRLNISSGRLTVMGLKIR